MRVLELGGFVHRQHEPLALEELLRYRIHWVASGLRTERPLLSEQTLNVHQVDINLFPHGLLASIAAAMDQGVGHILKVCPLVQLLRPACGDNTEGSRSEEHTSELQSLMRISYAVFCLKKKKQQPPDTMICSM